MRRVVVGESKIFISLANDVDRIFEKSWCVRAND